MRGWLTKKGSITIKAIQPEESWNKDKGQKSKTESC